MTAEHSERRFFLVLEARHASVMTAILELMASVTAVLALAGVYVNVELIAKYLKKIAAEDKEIDPTLAAVTAEDMDAVTHMMMVTILGLLLGIAIRTMLLMGAHKERRWLLLPWLVSRAVKLILGFSFLLVFIFFFFAPLPGSTILFTLAALATFAYQVHTWMAVNHLFSQLGQKKIFKLPNLEPSNIKHEKFENDFA